MVQIEVTENDLEIEKKIASNSLLAFRKIMHDKYW